MVMWQFLVILGVAFLILEMFTPVMFFLNFAIAAFITAGISVYTQNLYPLMIGFVAISLLLLLFVRPLLVKNKSNNEQITGMKSKYVGKTARVIDSVTKNSGAITIYDERWEARCLVDDEIQIGESVVIKDYDSLIMFVERK